MSELSKTGSSACFDSSSVFSLTSPLPDPSFDSVMTDIFSLNSTGISLFTSSFSLRFSSVDISAGNSSFLSQTVLCDVTEACFSTTASSVFSSVHEEII